MNNRSLEYEKIIDLLNTYHQEHVIQRLNQLDEKSREKLLNQLSQIDLELITKIYEETTGNGEIEYKENKIEPISYVDKNKLNDTEKQEYISVGNEIIKSEKFAVITMAGGQGTRLGHSGPKGTYLLIDEKSLFELLCENLKNAQKVYGVEIPWFIMTSEENHNETVEFFEENNYFEYSKSKVHFFKQKEMPMLDSSGKLMFKNKDTILEASDGNGGVFTALIKNKILEKLKQDEIEWILVGGVDNVLFKMIDPLFLGMTINKNIKSASKSVVKSNPNEKVGVFCRKNGKTSIIEYTELPKEMRTLRDEDNELLYGESNIISHLFHIDVLSNIEDSKMPYHAAFKKAAYVDENGKKIKPDSPNAYKFESFIFDAFSMIDEMGLLRVNREEEFAPVKNATGVDSPETARVLYENYWKKKESSN